MSKDDAKERGPRRGRGSITKNRAGNWQVRCTDPYGRRRAGGTYRLKGDADQQLAKILASIENNTWREFGNTVSGDLNPKTITLRQASIRYCKDRWNKNGQALSDYTTAEYARLVDKLLTRLADKPLRSIRRDDVNNWWAEVSERTPTQASRAYTHLNSVMRYALDMQWIRENPCRIKNGSNYRPAQDPAIPTEAEVAVMLQMAEQPLRAIVALAGDTPEMPEGLGTAGKQLWAEAYAQPWVTSSNRTMVLLIARKLDERETIAAQYYQTPADQWRQQRTLKDIDRDIVAGLDQLLLTPNSRRRARIEIADPEKDVLSPLELMMARKHGDITPEEYDRQKILSNSAGV